MNLDSPLVSFLVYAVIVVALVALVIVVAAIADRRGEQLRRLEYTRSLDDDVLVLDRHDLDILTGTEAFMRGAGQWLAVTPQWQDDDTRDLRHELLREEYSETVAADYNDDLVEYVDGLFDVIVVAYGSLLGTIGPRAARAVAAEITRSNLDKIGPDGPYVLRDDGKVGKPDGWRAPQIEAVLRAHGWKPAAACA